MFDSIGWGEIIVLIVAGLFILGPERLPEAAAWLGNAIRQVKDYATGAREQLKGEFGPEFDELRKPLDELRSLRNFNPRTAATRALFDDDGPAEKPNGYAPNMSKPSSTATNGTAANGTAANGTAANGSNGTPQRHPATGPAPQSLAKGERPPIDPDAT